MTRYFAQNTPRAGLEHMMMSVPGFQKRGGGMMILSRFCYKPEDVDCRYCLHYRRRSCQVRTCPYIAERLKSGAIEYLDLILEYFGHIPHAGLHKRIQAVEHWSGPDQAVLHTVSVHLRSRFADRVWDDAPPGYLAALYLLASKERLWQPALPALSHDSIDFSRIVSKPHGFAIQDYPIFYSARRLYDLKSPMEAEDLAHPKLVSDLDFHNIIYATMIARYGKAVMDASTRVKAIFYALYFAAEQPDTDGIHEFADCFVDYEERTRTVTTTDEEGNEVETTETYMVAVPIEDLAEIYERISHAIGVEVTADHQANADSIYHLILYGSPSGESGGWFPGADVPFIGVDGFCSPIGAGWESVVTSEFGYRSDPFTGETRGHTGIDLAVPTGTPIRAALPRTVTVSQYNSSYGYYVIIDHGNGLSTLYGHNSRLLAQVGQTVEAGDIISLSGSTGRSTGPHLHFEVRVNGERTNPRYYLPKTGG